jgi:hypothetical protein
MRRKAAWLGSKPIQGNDSWLAVALESFTEEGLGGSGSVATLQEQSDKRADMVLAPSVAGLFKWRLFEPEVILLAVGWYLRFSLSYP